MRDPRARGAGSRPWIVDGACRVNLNSTFAPIAGRAARTADFIDTHLLVVLGLISFVAWLTFGAVTWVDARSYIDIARELRSIEDFHQHHAGSRIWFHNYVPLALPLMWRFLEQIPVELIWPVVSLSNRVVAVLALVYFVRSLQTVHRSALFSVVAVLLALHPFYQAFQNAFITESMSSSLLILGLGLTIRQLAAGPGQGWKWLGWALICSRSRSSTASMSR